MTKDDTQRAIVRGLFISLILLIIAIILQLGAVVLLMADDTISVTDIEGIESISSLAVISLAIIGVISAYTKAINKKD